MSHICSSAEADSHMPATTALNGSASSIDLAILKTIVYGDIFEYPLTADEISRYLVGECATYETVLSRLSSSRLLSDHLTTIGDYYLLAGRDDIVATRRRRSRVANTLWSHARQYGRIIACMPFVRMVAVTGALAVDNAAPNTDVDYFIVTAPRRLWLSRAAVIAVVRWAGRQGVWLCPNYFVTERNLVFEEQSLYAAHEVTQMVPLAGMDTYRHLRRLNTWAMRYLPNAEGPPREQTASAVGQNVVRALSRAGEVALRTPAGEWIEQWEMNRKVEKFTANGNGHKEVHFGPDCCKGHFDEHGRRTLAQFTERLRELDLQIE